MLLQASTTTTGPTRFIGVMRTRGQSIELHLMGRNQEILIDQSQGVGCECGLDTKYLYLFVYLFIQLFMYISIYLFISSIR